MDVYRVLEILLTALATLSAAYFGSKWAHRFAVNERDRDERIASLKEVKKEIVHSYRKSMEYSETFLALIYEIKITQLEFPQYMPTKSFNLLHGLKYEIMNIEDQKLELDEEDLNIILEINRLLVLMKEDFDLMEKFFHEILLIQQNIDEVDLVKDRHIELINELETVELEFVKQSEKSIVQEIQKTLKKI